MLRRPGRCRSAARRPTAWPPTPTSCVAVGHPAAGLHDRLVDGVPPPDVRLIGVNAARFDAGKHLALPVVGDARGVAGRARRRTRRLDGAGRRGRRGWPTRWPATGTTSTASPTAAPSVQRPTYAQVVGCRLGPRPTADDYALTASGGFPGELNNGWRSRGVATFDCEYGFSCMGYEISGGWGAAMARARAGARTAGSIVFVGDGSYLMMNSDLYSSVLSGSPMIVVAVRQRRLRRHRPAAGQPGRRVVQQPARRQPGGRRPWCRSTSPPTPPRWAATRGGWRRIAELDDAVRRGAAGRSHDGDRHRRPTRTRGRRAARGGRSGCPRSATGRRSAPARAALERGQGRPAAGGVTASDASAVLGCGRIGRMHAELLARRVPGRAGRRARRRARRWPTRWSPASACRCSSTVDEALGRRCRRRRHLHEHRHPRRADRRRRRGPAWPIFCEKPIVARPRRGRRRARPRSRLPASRCTSASTAASTRPTAPCSEAVAVGRPRRPAPGAHHEPRPGAAAAGLHRTLGWAVRRHDDPRPRHGPLRRPAARSLEVVRHGCRAASTRRSASAGDIDTAVVVLRHEGGSTTVIDNSRHAVVRLRPAGRGVRVRAAWWPPRTRRPGRTVRWDADGGHRPPIPTFFLDRYTESYLHQWEAFVDAVAASGPTPVTGADGRAALVLASRRGGRWTRAAPSSPEPVVGASGRVSGGGWRGRRCRRPARSVSRPGATGSPGPVDAPVKSTRSRTSDQSTRAARAEKRATTTARMAIGSRRRATKRRDAEAGQHDGERQEGGAVAALAAELPEAVVRPRRRSRTTAARRRRRSPRRRRASSGADRARRPWRLRHPPRRRAAPAGSGVGTDGSGAGCGHADIVGGRRHARDARWARRPRSRPCMPKS